MYVSEPSALANWMRESRQNSGLTQKQVSELSGLRQATISKIENDPESCSIETLLRLARVYQLELHLLPMLAKGESYKHEISKLDW
ncbi:helix-turn-helix domain-containing protein [Vibrio vulnificus]|uniref:helix-turn-helix domain-containing protein n=1 Tax=Vibrio vulnificus TaxID=672 RepID=UPI001CDB8607|nr:helix-turn-helix transcriptional regulator [Vibrio vulnificus]MCA3989853.1 helix-turn-helix transcriptional regulator [Vibrio vulnificus]